MKVKDENNWIRIQDPDPLVRGMDPRIRIHPKMTWIRNTGLRVRKTHTCSLLPMVLKAKQTPLRDFEYSGEFTAPFRLDKNHTLVWKLQYAVTDRCRVFHTDAEFFIALVATNACG